MAATLDLKTVIDGDGHIFEDALGISGFLPPGYRERGPFELRWLFPPVDHLHASHMALRPPGSFSRAVGTEAWKEFMQAVGISSATVYPGVY